LLSLSPTPVVTVWPRISEFRIAEFSNASGNKWRSVKSGLNRARALGPLRLAEIALARIGPSASIAIKDFAECVEDFRSNPDAPVGKGFTCCSYVHLSIERASRVRCYAAAKHPTQ
jgi:hypothetical protein